MKIKTKDSVVINVKNKNTFLNDVLDIAKIAATIIITVIGISLICLIGLFTYKYII